MWCMCVVGVCGLVSLVCVVGVCGMCMWFGQCVCVVYLYIRVCFPHSSNTVLPHQLPLVPRPPDPQAPWSPPPPLSGSPDPQTPWSPLEPPGAPWPPSGPQTPWSPPPDPWTPVRLSPQSQSACAGQATHVELLNGRSAIRNLTFSVRTGK